MDDLELLREYATRQSDDAFGQLVDRHLGFVYSAALRQVSDPNLAEEGTQAVFILLARKAGSLGKRTIFAGWLYRATYYAARDLIRTESRRRRREQEALRMDTTMHE